MISGVPVTDSATRHWSSREWEVRRDLAACYRLAAHFRMTDLTYTHISARAPDGEREHFFLNAFGLMFDEVTASNLVKVDAQGNVIEDLTGLGVNRAGFVIHSAIHAARRDVVCIMHTHTAAGMAVSTHPEGLLPITQHAMRFHHRIGYHEYEGIAVDEAERERLATSLSEHKAMILRNHGLLTCGSSVAEAFNLMYYLERACQAQVASLGMCSGPLRAAPGAVDKTATLFDRGGAAASERDWAPLLRFLDRHQPDYKI